MARYDSVGDPLKGLADSAWKQLFADLRFCQADTTAHLDMWGADGIPTVLLASNAPQQFSQTPKALLSECRSLMVIVSGLDGRGVEYLRDLVSVSEPPQVRVVIVVYAACRTREKDLSDVLILENTEHLRAWVLPVSTWRQYSTWALVARKDSPNSVLWTASVGNFGLAGRVVDEAHLVIEADPLVVNQFVHWFSRIVDIATPLTADTAQIPALMPAQGTREAAERWDQYANRCTAAAVTRSFQAAIANSSEAGTVHSVQVVEKTIRDDLKIPEPDPLLQPLVQLFEKGDLVMIDKGSRIPPLDVPIKAEWFGISSFREVGVVSREVRYRISVLDERTNKALDARRKDTSSLREKFSFPLADGSRWMPHKAQGLFEAELKRKQEEGKQLLNSLISGKPEEWIKSKRDIVTRDADRQYEEFHSGKRMPKETINEILEALTDRFRAATSGNFLPKVSFIKTSFRPGRDSDQVSDWATARTLLRDVGEYPRAALKNRAYFFRGLEVSEKDLLAAMNVADDWFVDQWFQPESLGIAVEELGVLEQIDESALSDHNKCELVLDLLHRAKSLEDIRKATPKP
jgi:hypothetical protein